MNLFQKAKATEAPTTKTKKKQKEGFEIAGLEQLTALDAVIKSLTTLKETLDTDIKDTIADEFVTRGIDRKGRPENLRGVDNMASASCELRKRSTRSVLTTDEIEIMNTYKITVGTETDVQETYMINPKYKDNNELLAQVSEKLTGIDGLPDDFIILQEGKERKVVTDESLEQIFRAKPEAVKTLLMICGSLAIKPKLENSDIKYAMNIVNELMGLPT